MVTLEITISKKSAAMMSILTGLQTQTST